MGQRDVLIHPELERQPLAFAVLGQVTDTGFYGVLGVHDVQLSPFELDGPRVHAVRPEDRPGELRAPCSDEPGEAQNLPGADLERAILEYVGAGYALGRRTTSPISTSVLG